MTGIISLEIGVLADSCLRMIIREDSQHSLTVDHKLYQKIMFYSLVVGSWIERCLLHWKWYGQLACGVLAAYLLVASIQDMRSKEVYDFLHAMALPAGLVFVAAEPSKDKLISLAVFAAVQLGIFMRMYGAGDGLTFLVCAVFESRFGNGMLTYLLHMGAAYVLLAIVQGLRHNINKRGNLYEPVPFIPYITATVWLFL